MFASDVKLRHVRPEVDPVNRRHFGRILGQSPLLWNGGLRSAKSYDGSQYSLRQLKLTSRP